MYDVWRTIRREPAGALLVAANLIGLILAAWLIVIA
jgi:hypothetical protein